MMTKQLTILLFTLLTALTSLGQTHTKFTKADRYHTNKFDVAIFPHSYIDIIGGKRFTPTRVDIDKAELALQTNLKTLNKDLINQYSSPIIHKNLGKYKRQYFGYIDKNGDRILFINCFWFTNKKDSDEWLKDRVVVNDGGSNFWSVKFNLSKGKLFELDINGNA